MSGIRSTRNARKVGTVVRRVNFRVHGKLIAKVPLRLRSNTPHGRDTPTLDYVIDVDTPAHVRVSHADPNECIKLAQAEFDAALSIEWTPMLLVEVDERDTDFESGSFRAEHARCNATVTVSFTPYEMGTQGGTTVYRRALLLGEVSAPTTYNPLRNKRSGTALIARTPENEAKLVALVTGLHTIQSQLVAMLSQDMIERTLQSTQVLALPVSRASTDDAAPIDVSAKVLKKKVKSRRKAK